MGKWWQHFVSDVDVLCTFDHDVEKARNSTVQCSTSQTVRRLLCEPSRKWFPVFAGVRTPRGHGLGNICSGLVKAAMPLVKSGVRAPAKQGLKTGVQIAGDLLSGQKPKRAIKRRAKQAGAHLARTAMNQFGPPPLPPPGVRGRQPIKRCAPSRGRSSVRSKRQKDIFG